jgi:hypothetical protein
MTLLSETFRHPYMAKEYETFFRKRVLKLFQNNEEIYTIRYKKGERLRVSEDALNWCYNGRCNVDTTEI